MYGFARQKKIMALIGHTHRPLFESLSRLETLKIEIENLCRKYPQAAAGEKLELEAEADAPERGIRQAAAEGPPDAAALKISTTTARCCPACSTRAAASAATASRPSRSSAAAPPWSTGSTAASRTSISSPKATSRSSWATAIISAWFLKEEDLDYIFTRINLLD